MESLEEELNIINNRILQKKKLLKILKDEIGELKQNKKRLKKKFKNKRISYDVQDIIDILHLDDNIKSQIIKNYKGLKIYNKSGVNCHYFVIKYVYDDNTCTLHFGRRPDEYYHYYTVFYGNYSKTYEGRSIVDEFNNFDYNRIEDQTYFSQYITSLCLDKDYMLLGLAITCYYFLFDFYKNKHDDEYNNVLCKKESVIKMKKVVIKYKESSSDDKDHEESWYYC